ncbi:MAG: TetR/AcrR family transcriptional regulator [Ilumatobacter sp.]|nr:TetR/AcrR family transcriptional regulator [Ilumatobacter sp.]
MARPSNRDLILDTLERLIVERGAIGVTLEAVADEAGVSKGGLLYHFSTKSALFHGLLDRCDAQIDDELTTAPDDPAELVRWTIGLAVGSAERPSRLWQAVIDAAGAGDESYDARLVEIIERSYTPLQRLGPAVAAHTRLVADGLYFAPYMGTPVPAPELVDGVIDAIVARLAD